MILARDGYEERKKKRSATKKALQKNRMNVERRRSTDKHDGGHTKSDSNLARIF